MKTATMNTMKSFVNAAQLAIVKAGWNPKADLEIKTADKDNSPIFRYGYQASRVRLTYAPELAANLKQVLALLKNTAYSPDKNEVFSNVVASRVYMQVGSFNICPSYAEDYAEILEATSDGMRSAGATEPQVHDFTVYLTSFFIASVVSGVYGLAGPDPQRFRQGWSLDHLCSSLPTSTSLSNYMSIYVNILLRLWGNSYVPIDSLRNYFSQPLDTLEFETDRGVAILLDTFDFAGSGQDGLAWTDEKLSKLIIDELRYNYQSWPIKAFQFAEMLAPYMISDARERQLPSQTQPVPQQQSGSQPSPNPQTPTVSMLDGGQAGARPSDDAQARWDRLPSVNVPNIPNLVNNDDISVRYIRGVPRLPFSDQLINDQDFREEVLNGSIGIGGNPLKYHAHIEALDALYRSRAADMEVKSDTINKPGEAFDISHMIREELSGHWPGFNHIDWGATRIGTDGDPQLYLKQLPITDQMPAKFEMKGFPDLLLVIDSSGSMAWNSVTGSGSYDSLIRAIYSVFAYLERNRKAAYMRYAVVNFSSRTIQTPWHSYAELMKIKKAIFNRQGGGTMLDCKMLQNITDNSKDRFLCLMVTDARIRNANEVIHAVQHMINKDHRFVLIQIGSKTPMTDQLYTLGERVGVHVISDHRQLKGLYLDYTKKHWGI